MPVYLHVHCELSSQIWRLCVLHCRSTGTTAYWTSTQSVSQKISPTFSGSISPTTKNFKIKFLISTGRWTLHEIWNYKNFIIIIIMQHLMRHVSVLGATNRKTLTKLRHHNWRSSSVFLHFTGNVKNCDISATGWPTSIYVHYIRQDDAEWVLQVLRLLKD